MIRNAATKLISDDKVSVLVGPAVTANVIAESQVATDNKVPIIAPDANALPAQLGDAMSVTPPLYRTVKTTGPANERVQHGKDPLGIRQQLAGLASKLRDPRLAFLFNPGQWLPDLQGCTSADIDSLLESWVGGPQPITILDLSGIPSSILNDLIGALLRILYDAIFWSRNLPEGGRERPLLLVLEEAHAYLAKEVSGSAAMAVRRIAKEGRKYGVSLVVISQRPSEVNKTLLSQCSNFVSMRLTNAEDQGVIKRLLPDSLGGFSDILPTLDTGEALVVGDASLLPSRIRIDEPQNKPNSGTVNFWDEWQTQVKEKRLSTAVDNWRKQSIQ